MSDSEKGSVYILTGPTSGIGYRTALELSQHGTLVLVGRDLGRLDKVKQELEQQGRRAVCVVCDLSEPASVRRAAAEIIALKLPIAGLINNAGIMQPRATKNSLGWDMTFATNHVGPLLFTELLIPHLPDGANVLFLGSAVEDPERKLSVAAGFRGARYISADASARGEWLPAGSKMAGADAYATSKQGSIATAKVFARETPRLHFNALEPGWIPDSGLGRDANAFLRFVGSYVLPLLSPFIKQMSNPKKAGRLVTGIVTDRSGQTGVYFDERGKPMEGSQQLRDPKFTERYVDETRALLKTVPQ